MKTSDGSCPEMSRRNAANGHGLIGYRCPFLWEIAFCLSGCGKLQVSSDAVANVFRNGLVIGRALDVQPCTRRLKRFGEQLDVIFTGQPFGLATIRKI